MRVWRVARRPFADLSGEGARRHGGRWNSRGRPLLYTAENPALAILEVRVHLDLAPDLVPDDYVLVEIELGAVQIEAISELPEDPREQGDCWLARRSSPVLKVPSFVAPRSVNLLLDPTHPEAAAFGIVDLRRFSFDLRLWLPLR